MPTEKLEFAGTTGAHLAARLDRPAGPIKATALFAHCFTCGKDIRAARRIAARLAALGFAVMRFDFTGLGHSDGEFEHTGFSSNVEDLVAAASHLESVGLPPSLLIGHSLGGAAVLAAAARIASVKAVATINAPADPAHVLEHFGTSLETIREAGVAEVSLAGRNFRIARSFVEDIEASRLTEAIGTLKRALLVLHAPRDAVVGIEHASRIFVAAKHPKSFVTLDDADHLLSKPADADYTAEVIDAWATRYLELAPDPAPAEAPEGVVRATEVDQDGFLQDVVVGAHRLTADEPASVGGTDGGPTPYQFLSIGLGACTAMTLRMYARRKGIALDHVAVDVTHAKIHAADCADCETRTGKIDLFHRSIWLEGDLDQATRQRLLEIADKCPVHRTLEAEARIETSLAETR